MLTANNAAASKGEVGVVGPTMVQYERCPRNTGASLHVNQWVLYDVSTSTVTWGFPEIGAGQVLDSNRGS